MVTSRKDYEAIADAISIGRKVNGDGLAYDALAALAWELSSYFAEDNERFDRARFLRVCGFETLAQIEEQVEAFDG